MKLSYFIFMLSALMFIAFSCDNESTSALENVDNDSITINDDTLDDDTESVEETDAVEIQDDDVVEVPDEIEVPDEEPDDTPDVSDEYIKGNFSLTFNGIINTSSDFKSWLGGEGDVTFTDSGIESTYTKITVPMTSVGFPLTMIQDGKTVTVWLDKIDFNENHKVFGFVYPGTLEPGEYKMQETGASAFYGDVIIQATAGNFEIKCIRSATILGDFTVTADDGTNIEYSANGNLYDPSLAGDQLPYPVCED